MTSDGFQVLSWEDMDLILSKWPGDQIIREKKLQRFEYLKSAGDFRWIEVQINGKIIRLEKAELFADTDNFITTYHGLVWS